jgi:hypothetical protein
MTPFDAIVRAHRANKKRKRKAQPELAVEINTAVRGLVRASRTFGFHMRRISMLRKITLALALAITAITMSIPASARRGDAPYGGYEDGAYNRNGW